jgi:hypothetical protein
VLKVQLFCSTSRRCNFLQHRTRCHTNHNGVNGMVTMIIAGFTFRPVSGSVVIPVNAV